MSKYERGAVNAGAPRTRRPAYAEMSLSDWLATLFVSIIPGVNLVVLIYWSLFSRGNDARRNFSRAYLIVAPFSLILTIALFILFVYFFGIPILNYFTEQYGPKIY